jgi:LmbE family N-acetylglucosaminyl deacetylase
MTQKSYARIYLSPHLDDAALSCGGRIYRERRSGLSVLVLTLMAGDAPHEAADLPTPILADLHTRWELEANPNPVVDRRGEDIAALGILEADALHWDWPECVYRRHPHTGEFLYPSEESLWDRVHPSEYQLPDQLAERLADLPLAPGAKVFVPLTVGGHVDHHIVRQAAELWGAPTGELIFYEEYPYAEHPEALGGVLGNREGWEIEIVPVDEEALDAKAKAVAHYRSQISTFFTGADEIAIRLRAYAAIVGEGREWGERYWHRA